MNKCLSCGAPISISSSHCSYCSTPILNDSSTTEEDYISMIEKKLISSKDTYDRQVGVSFILLFTFWIFSSYLFYKYLSIIVFLLLSIVLGFVLFIIFGLIVIHYTSKATKEYFDKSVYTNLKSFLQSKNLSLIQFEAKAQEILGQESYLVNILTKLEP